MKFLNENADLITEQVIELANSSDTSAPGRKKTGKKKSLAVTQADLSARDGGK
jgi:hypothetical protein